MSNMNDTDCSEILERLKRLEEMLFNYMAVEDGNEPSEQDRDFDQDLPIDFSPESDKAYWAYQLEKYIDSMGLKYFKGSEFSQYWYKERSGVDNYPPPQEKWSNIVPTLVVLDRFREEMGESVKITSSYRAPNYNSAIGGEDKSQHMEFCAIDFKCIKGEPNEWANLIKSYRGQVFHNPATNTPFTFSGGIGVYNTFVHIDTRGYDANWRG